MIGEKELSILEKAKIKLFYPISPTIYHGKTQGEGISITSKNQSDNENETSEDEQTQKIIKELPFKSIGLGEYFTLLVDIEDSDDAILAWKNSEVFNISTEPTHTNNQVSKVEFELNFDNQEIIYLLPQNDPAFIPQKREENNALQNP